LIELPRSVGKSRHRKQVIFLARNNAQRLKSSFAKKKSRPH